MKDFITFVLIWRIQYWMDFTIITPRQCFKDSIYITKKLSVSRRLNFVNNKMNFLFFMKQFELEHMLKGIKKSNYDDIADTFMQMIAHLTI